MSHSRMATLASYFMSYFPLIISVAISCQLYNLNTAWNIIMILQSYVEQVMTMCHVQERQFLFVYFLSYLPLMVKATIPSSLNTIRNNFMRLYGSVEEVIRLLNNSLFGVFYSYFWAGDSCFSINFFKLTLWDSYFF